MAGDHDKQKWCGVARASGIDEPVPIIIRKKGPREGEISSTRVKDIDPAR